MPSGRNTPVFTGGSNSLAIAQANNCRAACFEGMTSDAVVQTLQKIPAPIAHLDVLHPYPLPQHPLVPMPGDPGGYATSRALEDR